MHLDLDKAEVVNQQDGFVRDKVYKVFISWKGFLLFKFFFPSFIDFDGVRRREFVRFVSFHLVREEGNRFESDQEENQRNQQKKNTQSLSVYVSKAA